MPAEKEVTNDSPRRWWVPHRPWPYPRRYVIPNKEKGTAPFDPTRSWAFAAVNVADETTRSMSRVMAWATAFAFTLSGTLLLSDTALWLPMAAAAAAAGLVLRGFFFHPWLAIGVLMDVGILWAAWAA